MGKKQNTQKKTKTTGKRGHIQPKMPGGDEKREHKVNSFHERISARDREKNARVKNPRGKSN